MENNIKTLVIHPKDISTDFLSDIYEGTDWTIINHNISKSLLKQSILSHDRIIMLGHGTPQGLIGFNRMMIDSELVYLLRKKNLVCIWCNADQFVKRYDLKGFYTGMIISEYEEALDNCIIPNLKQIEESNTLFATSIKNAISQNNMLELVKEKYVTKDNPIIGFNQERLFFKI